MIGDWEVMRRWRVESLREGKSLIYRAKVIKKIDMNKYLRYFVRKSDKFGAKIKEISRIVMLRELLLKFSISQRTIYKFLVDTSGIK